MDYTKEYVKEVVENYGEVFFVLESGRQYEVHGTDELSFEKAPNPSAASTSYTIVHVEGMHDGELLKVDFPLESIEHHLSHREI